MKKTCTVVVFFINYILITWFRFVCSLQIECKAITMFICRMLRLWLCRGLHIGQWGLWNHQSSNKQPHPSGMCNEGWIWLYSKYSRSLDNRFSLFFLVSQVSIWMSLRFSQYTVNVLYLPVYFYIAFLAACSVRLIKYIAKRHVRDIPCVYKYEFAEMLWILFLRLLIL